MNTDSVGKTIHPLGKRLVVSARPGASAIAPGADHLRCVHEAESAIRQHHQKLFAIRHEEKVIWRGHRQRTPIGQVNFKPLEWRSIAHFLQRLQHHDTGNLLRPDVSVNATPRSPRYAVQNQAWGNGAAGRPQFEISRKNCCGAVRGLVYGLVAAGRLVNGPMRAGADCKLNPALIQLSTS